MTELDQPKTLEEALHVIQRLHEQIRNQSQRLEELEKLPVTVRSSTGLREWLGFRRFFGWGSARGDSTESVAVLDSIFESGLFEKEFYCEQLQDRKDYQRGLKAPLKHYLEVGAFEGLDPSPGFDSDWYLASNPDVKAAGVNPLVHYIQHGQQEGRLPYHGARVQPSLGMPVSTSGFNNKMWSGFQSIAWPELQDSADKLLDGQAAWHLATWSFAHGDVEGALDRIEQSISLSQDGASLRALIGLAKCYSIMREPAAIQSLIAEPGNSQHLGSSLPYVQANALRGDQQSHARLGSLNELFNKAGLNAVALKEPYRPLALDNLKGEGISHSSDTLVTTVEAPKVSVIVPVFNAGGTLHTALDGLLGQTFSSLEIIVVDDGSSDNTKEVALTYAERDSRVRYIANAANMGAYPSRNEGMKAARGEFVTVHDSDDWSHPQKLERQLQPLLNDSSKIASFSSWVRVLDDLTFVGPWLLDEHFVEKNHSSALIRRSALDVVGYWDNVNIAADTEFLWRLEHHYGHQAIVHVLPCTPLSFALSDDSTLTRTKATHVKTIHYGLRRVYRESARWWHRQNDGKPVMSEAGKRPFPVPLGICRASPSEFDCIVAADFAVQGEKLHRALQGIKERLACGLRLCLFHWPDYTGWHGAVIADEIFALCQEHGLGFAHVGISVSAPAVVLVDEALWQYPPSQAVQVEALERVENANGDPCEQQGELMAYFRNGGVPDAIVDRGV